MHLLKTRCRTVPLGETLGAASEVRLEDLRESVVISYVSFWSSTFRIPRQFDGPASPMAGSVMACFGFTGFGSGSLEASQLSESSTHSKDHAGFAQGRPPSTSSSWGVVGSEEDKRCLPLQRRFSFGLVLEESRSSFVDSDEVDGFRFRSL